MTLSKQAPPEYSLYNNANARNCCGGRERKSGFVAPFAPNTVTLAPAASGHIRHSRNREGLRGCYAAARPTTRSISRQGSTRNDSFSHNDKSELTAATLGADTYAYDYDNIGNRAAAVENSSGVASRTEYQSNNLNQYTAIDDFTPEYDLDGNQTRIKTSTGIWLATYNALNRPVRFESADGTTVISADYDYMGRRVFKRVEQNGSTTGHLRFLYRGYLQIDSPPPHRRLTPAGQSRFAHCPTGLTAVGRLAALDLTRPTLNPMWYITWDPTQDTATRPLAIQKDRTWYTYGWDLTKNICEVFGQAGYVRSTYTYTPYGAVTADGDVQQPIQWSSEYNDTELGLVYYNYRHYNPTMGRWMGRDVITTLLNDYLICSNEIVVNCDYIGLIQIKKKKHNNTSNCLGGAMTNCGDQYRYPNVNAAHSDNMIEAMRKEGWACREVKIAKECQCASDEAKILITLYKGLSNYHKKRNPWTDKRFPWGTTSVDLHAIRSDSGQGDKYKQIPHADKNSQKFDTDIDWDLFKNTPLLCCCETKKCQKK